MGIYQEYIFDDKAVFVSLDESADYEGKEDSIKHIVVLEDNNLRVITSSSVKVIPDLIYLAKRFAIPIESNQVKDGDETNK